jgi:hypothetical protein
VPLVQVELGQQGAGFLRRPPRPVDEGADEGEVRLQERALLGEPADHNARPDPSCPRRRVELAEQGVEQRRLARAVRSLDRDPLAPRDVEVDRAEPERAALQDRLIQFEHGLSGPARGREREPQRPRLRRLLDLVMLQLLQPPGSRAGLGHQRVRPAPAGALAVRARLLAPIVVEIAEPAPLGIPTPVGALVVASYPFAGSLVIAPPSDELPHTLRPGPELEDAAHGAVEERPVVRDDHDPCVDRREEPLEELETGEVEIVGRLVEQVHVEPCEEDRREREARALAARERAGTAVERNVQPDAREDLVCPPIDLLARAPPAASARSSVDLPRPFGPTTPIRAPAATVSETCSRTSAEPFVIVISVAASVAPYM